MNKEQVYLYYQAKISLKFRKTGKFVSVNHENDQLSGTGFHPILYVHDLEIPVQEELTLLKFENRNSTDPVTFGS